MRAISAIQYGVAVFSILFLSNCSTPLDFADPAEITLAQALDQTACGLATYSNSLETFRTRPGTLVDTVEVNFQVKGSSKNNNELVLDTKIGEIGPLASLGLNYANKTENYGERSNNIKIVMRNMYTVGLNNPGLRVVSRDGPSIRKVYKGPLYERPCDKQDRGAYFERPNPRSINYDRLRRGSE